MEAKLEDGVGKIKVIDVLMSGIDVGLELISESPHFSFHF